MPSATKLPNNKNKTNIKRIPAGAQQPKKSLNKWPLAIVIAAILLGIFWLVGGKNMFIQKGMESYLEDKYKKEFVVSTPKREGHGLGVPGQHTSEAYPVDDKELIFEVGRYSTGEFYDTYVSSLWSREAFQEAERAVQSIFENKLPWLEVKVYPINTVTGRKDRTSDLYNKLPPLDVQIAQDPSVVVYRVHVRMDGAFDANEKRQHEDRLLKLMQFVIGKKTGEGSVRYVVNLNNEDAKYVCDEFIKNASEIGKISECFEKYSVREGVKRR
jgi:hypothetical protein